MRKTILKITVVLLVIIFLPIGFFLVNDLTKLNQDEQMVEQVYNKQLASILTAVNQHSENIISYWASSLDLPVDCNSEAMKGIAGNLLINNPSIRQIGFTLINSEKPLAVYSRNNEKGSTVQVPKGEDINQLIEFIRDDYQKIEVLKHDDLTVLYFVMKNQQQATLCFINVVTEQFILQSLGPEIQQVSQDMFYIAVSDSVSKQVIFATENSATDTNDLQQTSLWYFPGYQIGIRLLSRTIDELVKERSKKGRYILWGLVIVVVFGAVFVIWNIRKEIILAELKSGFVSNVSHEIRTPLALIAMYAETLRLKRLKKLEKQDEYLEVIHSESEKLANMVNRILNFSKIEKGKRIFNTQNIPLLEFIPNVMDSYKPYFEENKVDVTCNMPEEEIFINADREAISEVFFNLFDNAVKYGKETGKRVEVRCLKHKKNIVIEVEDNGIGISGKDRKYIFDKFYRARKGDLANRVKGSGLGLNIVRQVMKGHGGDVSVKSKLNEGSCFRLKFPMNKK
ncbi:MAG: HAMP domain-containing histidine kinase [Prolixibacteraceae bacterium]|nr:HAMP domain-containing histidine kinase [Prolixibacteraceae bacterium]MBN2775957.1 HAMP domain-containing histidine kinase [Prolixibacteraceae bacterium]